MHYVARGVVRGVAHYSKAQALQRLRGEDLQAAMTKHKEAAVRRPRWPAAQRAAARGRLVHPAAQHLGVHSVATRCALGLQAPPQPRNDWMVDDGEPATMGG